MFAGGWIFTGGGGGGGGAVVVGVGLVEAVVGGAGAVLVEAVVERDALADARGVRGVAASDGLGVRVLGELVGIGGSDAGSRQVRAQPVPTD